MKVEISYRNYALFSRYSRVKVHIANPDSNLVALNHAAEWCRSAEAFNDDIMVKNHETEIERGQGLSRKLPNEERRAASKIAVSDSRGGMFLAFAGVYGS